MKSERRFYVYVYFRCGGCPCYVGKGQGRRWRDHFYNSACGNSHLKRIIAKAGGNLPVVIVRSNLTNAEAIETEIAFIAAIGRRDLKTGPLVNKTAGGEGKREYQTSKETAAKIAASNTGKTLSDETLAKMSLASKGKKKSPSHAANIAAGQLGKKRSDAAVETQRRLWDDPARRETARERAILQHATMSLEKKEARARKCALGNTGKHPSEDTRKKMSESHKLLEARKREPV